MSQNPESNAEQIAPADQQPPAPEDAPKPSKESWSGGKLFRDSRNHLFIRSDNGTMRRAVIVDGQVYRKRNHTKSETKALKRRRRQRRRQTADT